MTEALFWTYQGIVPEQVVVTFAVVTVFRNVVRAPSASW